MSAHVVCDGCGFYHGLVAISHDDEVCCPECGSEAAWAFSTLEKANRYQAQVRERPKLPEAAG